MSSGRITDKDEEIAIRSIKPEILANKIINYLDNIGNKEIITKINKSLVEQKANWKKGTQRMEEIYLDLIKGYSKSF